MKSTKGFTLIELLVVIAIIGILSSVVLASVSTARSKSADAAIKSGLSGIRTQAEIFYDTPGNYNGVCSDPVITAMITSVAKQAGTANCTASTTPPAQSWVASAPLKSDSTKHWCVDSKGASKEITATGTSTPAGSCN